jgi:peptidyl-prolyl cis-trans isomerase D
MGGYGIVSVTRAITRDGFVAGAPTSLLSTVFAMTEGEVRVIQGEGFTGLVRLDAIQPAEAASEDAEALRDSIELRARQQLAQDAFTLFTNALSAEAGIQIDQTAINAVHAQMN